MKCLVRWDGRESRRKGDMGTIGVIASSGGSSFDAAQALLAQVASLVPVGAVERDMLHIGYAHTVYLTLMAAELARLELLHARSAPHGLPMAASACPALPDRALSDAFAKWVDTHCPSVTFHG